jgi:serine/threonine-protein kinase
LAFPLDPNNPQGRLRQAQTELKRRLRAGEDCRVEQILASYPDLAADTECAIDLIYDEFETREEIGQQPDPEEYSVRFPQWQKDLKRLFAVHQETQEESPAVLTLYTDGPNGSEECYQVIQAISQGPMGRVYKALHVRLNRVVAVKGFSGRHVADALRFRTGAREQAGLQHPNILPVYDVGVSEEGLPCFTMEFAEGGNLDKRSAGKPLPAGECARLVRALAEAMSYAHAQGVIHRDLKPANVVLTADGIPKITDFGLAKKLEGPTGQTADGDVLGTPPYMAPEQAAGRIQEIDPRTDVYGLGAILYHLLTGRPPYRGRTVLETLHQVLTHDLVWPRKIDRRCDRRLESICLKCLEKSRERRYPSAEELADDLGRWLCHKPLWADRWMARLGRMTRRRHVRRTTAAGLLASLVLLSGMTLPLLVPSPDKIAEQQERAQRQFIRSELDAGRGVTLIGEPGERIAFGGIAKPLGFRWHVKHHTAAISEAEDKAFSIHSFRYGMLELLDGPLPRKYRFRLRVRHDDLHGMPAELHDVTSEVGFYFAHHCVRTDRGLCHIYCTFTFNDLVDMTKMPDGVGLHRNLLKLRLQLFSETGVAYFRSILAACDFLPIVRQQPAGRCWRQMEMEWNSEEVKVCWENDCIVSIKNADLLKTARSHLEKNHIDPQAADELCSGLRPQGGLGLFLFNGTASFQLVRVKPFAEDEH